MTHGLPLFSYTPSYPARAGFKERTTSREAAQGIEASGKAELLREAILELYRSGFTGTADDCAHRIGESILSIRPRVAELKARQVLVATGERRAMDGGRMGHVLRAA